MFLKKLENSLKSLILKRFKRKEKKRKALTFPPFKFGRPTGRGSFPSDGPPTLIPFSFFSQPLTCRSHLLASPSIPRPSPPLFRTGAPPESLPRLPAFPAPLHSLTPSERQTILAPLPFPILFPFLLSHIPQCPPAIKRKAASRHPPSTSHSPLSNCLKPRCHPCSLPFAPAHTFPRARAPNPPGTVVVSKVRRP